MTANCKRLHYRKEFFLKELTKATLTGVPEIDKYYYQKLDLLQGVNINDAYQLWYKYLLNHLNSEQLQNYLNNHYPEGYSGYMGQYYLNEVDNSLLSRADYNLFYDLTYQLIEENVWVEQIAESLANNESIFTYADDLKLIETIINITLDETIISLFIDYPHSVIREDVQKRLKQLSLT